VPRLQSLLRKRVYKAAEAARQAGVADRKATALPGLMLKGYTTLCPQPVSAEQTPSKDPPETYFCITPGSQQAPPPAAVNPLHAFTEASTHIKHIVISLMCCSLEGEQQAD